MEKRFFRTGLVLMLVLCLSACSTSGVVGNSKQNQSENQFSAEPSENTEDVVLLDDDYIKATYLDVFEADGVDGVFYLSINVENKSDKEIWVYLSDASVNGMSIMVASGIPMTIQPGKSSKNPFIFSYSLLNIATLDELEDISFKFTVADNATTSTIETSDVVTIPFD